MKKYLAFASIAITAIFLSSFNTEAPKPTGEKEGVSNSEVWTFMRENVFDELNTLVNYKKEKMFSRCPSGFGQYMDKEKSGDQFVYGTITFAQGCDQEEFCLYKLDWNKKTTRLKKPDKTAYVDLKTFVSQNKTKTAKI